MKRKILIASIVMMVFGPAVFAAGTGAMDILKVPSGIKSQAMGGASIAACDDLEALDINPAGLVSIEGNDLLLIHDLYLQDVFYDSVYFAHSMQNSGTIGGAIKYLSGGSITQTNETPEGTYGGTGASVSGMAFLASLGYGINLGKLAYSDFTKNLNVGATFKFSGQVIGDNYSDMAVSFDLGAIYTIILEEADFMSNRGETIWNKVGIGFAVRNLGTSFSSGMTPLSVALGGYTQVLNLFGSTNRLRISADTDYNTGNGLNLKAGMEYTHMFGDFGLALRFGGNYNPSERISSGFSIGTGLSFKINRTKCSFDYVYMPYGDLGTSNKIGFYIKF